MLQRVLATLLCVAGVVLVGLAVASATFWRSPDTLTASASAEAGQTMVMTEAGVLDLGADEVTVRASAPDGEPVVLALGRTADVEAWIGEDAHTRVTGLVDEETLAVQARASGATEDAAGGDDATAGDANAGDATAEDATAGEGTAVADDPEVPAPAGSDLWVQEVTGDGEAELTWTREPGRWSVLVAAAGAPPTVTLSWPQVVTTPWLVPGIAAGTVALLAGLVWWALLLRRRTTTRDAGTVAGGPGTGGATAVDPSRDGGSEPSEGTTTDGEQR